MEQEDDRASKRVKQACLTCRRKKTRCSGEQPVCSFCARLNQPCVWDTNKDRSASFTNNPSGYVNPTDSALAARVALLEAKLSLLGGENSLDAPIAPATKGPAGGENDANSSPLAAEGSAAASLLPERATLIGLIDTYFTYCHCQPYAYFHEPTFRQRFEDNLLPSSLLLAVSATACRFKTDDGVNSSSHTIDTYASAAWAQVFQQMFSYYDEPDVTAVQTISMLAVIDFTAGHPRHGWVKVGLSVRFAQALRLNEEPSADLSVWEREERRRTFWSMYILDRLISLGPDRPISFADSDCTVRLPSPDTAFFNGIEPASIPNLDSVINDPNAYAQLDYFALTAVMAHSLGHFIRYNLKRASVESFAPWDYRSSYWRIHSMLLQHESHSLLTYANLTEVIQTQLTLGSFIDRQRTGHLVLSQAIFHVNHCLLNHPFILYNLFQRSSGLVPLSFAKEALDRSYNHATQLLDLLDEAQECGRLAETSFFGYCAILSGVIFRLYEHHHDSSTVTIAEERVKTALQYLERQPVRWTFHPHMASVLRDFRPTAELAKALIDPIQLAQKTSIDKPEAMWSLIDYSALQGGKGRSNSLSSAGTIANDPPDGTSAPLNRTISHQEVSSSSTFPRFHSGFGYPGSGMQEYLGDDMGSVWASVFTGQSWTGST
jgi:hypothetical protein